MIVALHMCPQRITFKWRVPRGDKSSMTVQPCCFYKENCIAKYNINHINVAFRVNEKIPINFQIEPGHSISYKMVCAPKNDSAQYILSWQLMFVVVRTAVMLVVFCVLASDRHWDLCFVSSQCFLITWVSLRCFTYEAEDPYRDRIYILNLELHEN